MARLAFTFFLAGALITLLGCRIEKEKPTTSESSNPSTLPKEIDAAEITAVAKGNNEFAFDLYRELAKKAKPDENIFFSPYSIRTALAMTYAGARSETAQQMKSVLQFNLPDEKLHPALGAMAHQNQGGKDKPFTLNVANALWGQRDFPFRPEFLDLNRKYYSGGFREMDFVGDPGDSRRTINHWIAERTEDRIKELLKEEDLTTDARLVLTNAIYFKGTWERPFPKEQTEAEDFETKPGSRVKVPMMHGEGQFRYHAGTEFGLLELPYRGDHLSMLILLPTKRSGLREVEQAIAADQLRESMKSLSDHDGTVAMPRFKSDSRLNLNVPLKAMGMPLAFSGGADFSGIASPSSLQISSVIHQGTIEVNEEGTVAAASTAVMMAVSSTGRVFNFRADHPFLFVIVDRKTGTVLFLGRLVSPA